MKQHLEILQEAERYLGNVEKATQTMINQLKEGNIDNIFHMLGMLSKGIEWLLTAFKITEDIQIEKIDTSEVTDTVSTIVEGMENKDWMLLSDCLEYSFLEQVIEWKRMIRVTLDYYNMPSLEIEETIE